MERICEKSKASHWKKRKIQSAWPAFYALWRQGSVTGKTLGNPQCEGADASGLKWSEVSMSNCCLEGKQQCDLSSGLPAVVSSPLMMSGVWHIGTLFLSSKYTCTHPGEFSLHTALKHFLQVSSVQSPQSFNTFFFLLKEPSFYAML